ncbi:MAG: hypothetical protein NT018_13245 [Armatimonadetes bacterium]|nr:hypothetical protein [Armatimonadota bacterium]
MKELIAPKTVELVMLIIAIAGPIVGLIAGAIIGACRKCLRPSIIIGGLIGCFGTIIYAMWRLYGVITDALGLDSVANLCLHLIMFAILGGLLGVASFNIALKIKRFGAGN